MVQVIQRCGLVLSGGVRLELDVMCVATDVSVDDIVWVRLKYNAPLSADIAMAIRGRRMATGMVGIDSTPSFAYHRYTLS